jgi:hypothetical protein
MASPLAADPLRVVFKELAESAVRDFKLEDQPLEKRNELLDTLGRFTLERALLKVFEKLDDDSPIAKAFEAVANDQSKAPAAKSEAILELALRVDPSLPKLLRSEYSSLKRYILERVENPFKDADDLAEGLSELAGTVDEAIGDAGVNAPALSVAAAGFDLLFDPARFQRTPEQRQLRLSRQVAVLSAQAAGLYWVNLLLFSIADALRAAGWIEAVPPYLSLLPPHWYEARSPGAQLVALVIMLPVGAVLYYGLVRVLVAIGNAPSLRGAFEMKIDDADLVSGHICSGLAAVFPGGIPDDSLRKMAGVVYTSIYNHSRRPNRDDLSMRESLLKQGNERAAVAFLKSKVPNYRSVMQREARAFCDDTSTIMSQIR